MADQNFNFCTYSCTLVDPGTNFGMLDHVSWGEDPTVGSYVGTGVSIAAWVDGGMAMQDLPPGSHSFGYSEKNGEIPKPASQNCKVAGAPGSSATSVKGISPLPTGSPRIHNP